MALSEDTLPARLLGMMPHAVDLGVELLSVSPEEVRGRLPWAVQRCTVGGALHGGALMSLADTAGAVCGYLNLPEGAATSTVESSTRFFRPVSGGAAHAVATPVHRGRRFVTVQTDLLDDDGRLVARTTQTQAVLPPPAEAGTVGR